MSLIQQQSSALAGPRTQACLGTMYVYIKIEDQGMPAASTKATRKMGATGGLELHKA